MIKVYMESNVVSELVAVFEDEETYMACLPALENLKEKYNWDKITESETDYSLSRLDNFIEPF